MEQWKDIPDYEGLYRINEYGKIKALQKSWVTGRGNGRPHVQPEIKPHNVYAYLKGRNPNPTSLRYA